MYVNRNISWKVILKFAWAHLIIFIIWDVLVLLLIHYLEHIGLDPHIPFLPLSTIGIAVAFYIGFKNNAAYDRFWEARKIWGGIVNYSRTWANQVLCFVTTKHAIGTIDKMELQRIRKELIYRHIAYINTLRLSLRRPSSTAPKYSKTVKKTLTFGAPAESNWIAEVKPFLGEAEFEDYCKVVNAPTQMLRRQSEDLRTYTEEMGLIDDFRHMEMMRVIEEFYNLQGKCERIKGTPFPRQYGYFSKLFTWIFIILLPFGMLGEFSSMGHHMEWLAAPFCVLISWIFMTMELIGDNSEDPFENFVNDVPMTAICRTIEIDLREMLGEIDLPPKIAAQDGILM
jgi:putative membrane protein